MPPVLVANAPDRRVEASVIAGATVLLAVAVGVAVTAPLAGIAVGFGLPALWLLVRSATARMTWYVGGALAVFGGDSVGAPKVAYLAGTIVVAAIALVRVERSRAVWMRVWRPVLPATVVMLGLVGLSAVSAWSSGAGIMDWVRDAMPYALLALSPAIALDAAHSVSARALTRTVAVVSTVCAIGATAYWLERRGVSSLPFASFLMPSGMPALLGLCLALGHLAAGRHMLRWAVLAVTIPAIMLASGGRTVTTWAVALLGMIGARRRARATPWKVATLAVVALVGVWQAAPLLAGVMGDRQFFDRRVEMALTVADEGVSQDGSFTGRAIAYDRALDLWHSAPWWGVGPGVIGTLDSPLVTLAKFGAAGTALIVTFIALMFWCGWRSGRAYGWTPAHTAARCFLAVLIVGIPLGPRVEDKGFALALALTICSLAVAARDGHVYGEGTPGAPKPQTQAAMSVSAQGGSALRFAQDKASN